MWTSQGLNLGPPDYESGSFQIDAVAESVPVNGIWEILDCFKRAAA